MDLNREVWTEKTCLNCLEKFPVRKSRLKYRKGNGSFCSIRCFAHSKIKRDTIFYKHIPFYLAQGYYVNNNYGRLNRFVWEQHYGKIPKGHIVHHKNGKKIDNRIENLELIEWGLHTTKHRTKGITIGYLSCRHCGTLFARRKSEINKGQNKYCSRKCSNLNRGRRKNGTYI